MIEPRICEKPACYETFISGTAYQLHLVEDHGVRRSRAKKTPWDDDTPNVVDGGIAKDPMQNYADAERNVTKANNSLKRAKRGLTRFRTALSVMLTVALIGVALIFFAGFLDTIGMESMANASRGVGIPAMIIACITAAFWTINASDNKVFENRDEAEKQVDEAEEQRERVVAMLPEAVLQYNALGMSDAVSKLQALGK